MKNDGITHAEGCWSWGPQHYWCALSEIARLSRPGFVDRVLDWNHAAGNTTREFNPRQAALYVGLILEEVAELLGEFRGDIYVRQLAERFKRGEFDEAMTNADRVALADAGCDIAVTAVGLLGSLGVDVQGALHEVCDSNDSKLVDGRLLKDENGKVVKPDGYRPPALEPFLVDVDGG